MALTTAEGLTDWAAGTARAGFRRRNWPVVRRLAAATVTLLLVGLPADFCRITRSGDRLLGWCRRRRHGDARLVRRSSSVCRADACTSLVVAAQK